MWVGEGSDQVLGRVGRAQMVQTRSHVSHLAVSVHRVGSCGGGLGVAGRVRRLFGPEWRWVPPGQINCVHSGSCNTVQAQTGTSTSTCPAPTWIAPGPWCKPSQSLLAPDSDLSLLKSETWERGQQTWDLQSG